ncbi:hypothetical protein B0T17DRAFT_377576 [Bombardia bombarda]|uniref:DUF6594 domain-containing protein n=1 Tax=Bombardia bombarda TaxID=252184 RepID=A0AA39WGR4_9PEZI|nr:hypothetical protein B0T17DRAFT_377576 [Bombardia bombarda]
MDHPPSTTPPTMSTTDEPEDVYRLLLAAKVMDQYHDLTVFRRYDQFNILNILILQKEMQKLGDDLVRLCPDGTSGVLASRRLQLVIDALEGLDHELDRQNENERTQKAARLAAWKKLKEKQKEYNSALLEFDRLRKMDIPDEHSLGDVDNFLRYAWVSGPYSTSDGIGDYTIPGGRGGTSRLTVAPFIFKFIIWPGVLRCVNYLLELFGSLSKISIPTSDEIILPTKDQVETRNATFSRLAMALFGGIALIAPTIIMAKYPGVNISLITTSVAVVIFSLVLAVGATKSTGKDILQATAAYTAVLVVFVGTSLAGGTPVSTADPSPASS